MLPIEKSSSGFVTPIYTAGNLGPAAEAVCSGGLVVFPTETVYGLGASALIDQAVGRIFTAKGRPQDNPLILHIASTSLLGEAVASVPRSAELLFEAFAPGPLTIVLPKASRVSAMVTAGLSTVGIRIPSHPVAREFLQLCGVPVAAPSANISGRPSPTSLEMALSGLDGKVECAVDGGFCRHGIESTIVRCTDDEVTLLRPGAITVEMIARCLGEDLPGVRVRESGSDPGRTAATVSAAGHEASARAGGTARPEAPGMSYRHYQPRAEVFVTDRVDGPRVRKQFHGRRFGVIAINRPPTGVGPATPVYVMNSAEEYAHLLYRKLIWFDHQGCEVIVAELPPSEGVGRAVRDRLIRAAGGHRL